MNPDTLDEVISNETEQPFEVVEQAYIDHLYSLLEHQDLLNDHEHMMAHRIIDLITSVRQLHHDLDNPPDASESKSPSMLDTLRKIFDLAHETSKARGDDANE